MGRSGSADSLGRSGRADSLGRSGRADSLGRSGRADSLGRSGSAELDGTSGDDDVTSGDEGELDETRVDLEGSLEFGRPGEPLERYVEILGMG